MGRQGFISASAPGRNTTSVLLLLALLLVLSIAIPAVASSKTPARTAVGIPSCASLSRTAMAALVGTGPLTLKSITGNFCMFTGQRSGHYKPTLEVEIVPYIKFVWNTAQSDAMHSASVQGSTFGRFTSKLFFVSGTVTSAGMSPYTADEKVSEELAPQCAGQPSLTHLTAIGCGSYKSSGLQLMVSTGLAATLHAVYESR
jgi:hypothetical protein